MSLQFNDTSTYKGIVQIYEKECGFPRGTVSGDSDKLKELAADANLAFDNFVALALQADGRWQFDDSNQSDYPIITTNLVSGQRDYAFTTDGSSNLILEIFKVFVADTTGKFFEIYPVDVSTGSYSPGLPANPGSGRLYTTGLSSFTDGQNATGLPYRYDKLANGIFLDPIPNYNSTNGLKVYINREPSYFVSTDTTKKPGVPGLFHRYFALRPALDYARRNMRAELPILQQEVLRMEAAIQEYFSSRNRDERRRLIPTYQNNK